MAGTAGNPVPSAQTYAHTLENQWLVPVLCAAAAFTLYVACLPPTVTGEDAGELITAAWSLGIPHPPGYPLWCLLAHPFTWVPIGEVAWRVALSSAFFAAATVGLTAWLAQRLARRYTAGVIAAILLGLNREFWEQAVIAEVYALNAMLIMAAACLLYLWHTRQQNRWLYACTFVFGLGCANHHTFLVLAPLFLIAVLWADKQPGRPRRYAIAAACLLPSLLVYTYLPLRSLADPPVDWGNPETLQRWWDVVSRRQYAFMMHQNPHSLERFISQMAIWPRFWLRDFAYLGALLTLGGYIVFWMRHWRYALFGTAGALMVLVGFTFAQNFNFDQEWLWVMSVFPIPAYLLCAIAGGMAAAAFGRAGVAASTATAVLAGLLMLALFLPLNSRADYHWAADYGRNILRTLPEDAVYIAASDHGAFTVLYLQAVQGLRPDVWNARPYGYLDSGLAEGMPPERTQWRLGPPQEEEPEILAHFLTRANRPLFVEDRVRFAPEAPWRQVPAGLLWQVLRPGEEAAEEDYWEQYEWQEPLEHAPALGDYTSKLIAYEVWMARARDMLIAGEDEEAVKLVNKAVYGYGVDVNSANNAGVLLARYGQYENAAAFFELALEHAPDSAAAQRNLERARKALNKESPGIR